MAGLPFRNGLTPVNAGGRAAPYNGGFNVYRASSTNAAMYSGDPLALTAGGKVIPATTAAGDILGVAVGFAWISPTTKQPVMSRYLPANTSSAAGKLEDANFGADSGAVVYVVDDMEQVYAVKSENSIAIAQLGDKIVWSASAGSALTGQSGGRVSAATATSVAFLRCVGVYKATGEAIPSSAGATAVNDWGAPETVILVKLDDTVGL